MLGVGSFEVEVVMVMVIVMVVAVVMVSSCGGCVGLAYSFLDGGRNHVALERSLLYIYGSFWEVGK